MATKKAPGGLPAFVQQLRALGVTEYEGDGPARRPVKLKLGNLPAPAPAVSGELVGPAPVRKPIPLQVPKDLQDAGVTADMYADALAQAEALIPS